MNKRIMTAVIGFICGFLIINFWPRHYSISGVQSNKKTIPLTQDSSNLNRSTQDIFSKSSSQHLEDSVKALTKEIELIEKSIGVPLNQPKRPLDLPAQSSPKFTNEQIIEFWLKKAVDSGDIINYQRVNATFSYDSNGNNKIEHENGEKITIKDIYIFRAYDGGYRAVTRSATEKGVLRPYLPLDLSIYSIETEPDKLNKAYEKISDNLHIVGQSWVRVTRDEVEKEFEEYLSQCSITHERNGKIELESPADVFIIPYIIKTKQHDHIIAVDSELGGYLTKRHINLPYFQYDEMQHINKDVRMDWLRKMVSSTPSLESKFKVEISRTDEITSSVQR